MIRPMTLLSMIAAAGAGLYLYQVKHSVAQLDRELRSVHRQTEQARERAQVLRAEWALLNEPERLRGVVQRHLALEAMAPAQFVRMSEVDRRLPAARSFQGQASLFAPVDQPGDGRATALALAEPRSRTAPESAVVVATVAPPPPAVEAAAPAPAPAPARAAAAAAPTVVAAAAPAAPAPAAEPPARPAARAAAAPRPARPPAAAPPVRTALHVEPSAPRQPIQRVAAPPAPQITSVLGGGGPALAPPVPIARAAAATLSGAR